MNIATRSNNDRETHSTSPGPGSLLKDAREAAGLSLRDVTDKLHLDLKVITALEEDNFSALPTATFVRGYLRSYTQLLGLPVGPVLEALDNEHLSAPELIADIAEAPQARSDDMPVRLASYGVIAALTIMVVLWWNNQDFDFSELIQPGSEIAIQDTGSNTQSPPATTLVKSPQTEQPLVADPRTVDPGTTPADSADNAEITSVVVQKANTSDPVTTAEPTPGSESALPANLTAAADTTAEDADPLEQQLAEARKSIEASRQVLDRNQTQVDTQPVTDSEPAEATSAPSQDQTTSTAPQPQTTASTAGPEATGADSSSASLAGEDTLSMRFTRESWVTVLDRNEKRLFYNLTRPDQTLELRGPGPLRVLLGRPQGVTVMYNGKLMDLSPHISSSGVARFTGNP